MSWTLIEHQALSSSVASVTLGSGGTIPQTYKTLKLVCAIRNETSRNFFFKINNTTTNLTWRSLQGDGSSVASYNGSTTQYAIPSANVNSDTANTFCNTEITLPNYAGSTNKPYSVDGVQETNATQAYQAIYAGLWSSTSAVTSLVIQCDSGNIVSGSTFTLYGLA